jgi:hypothetical protein
VDWSNSRVPLWRQLIRWLPTIVGAGLQLLTQSGSGPLNGPPAKDPKITPGSGTPIGHLVVTGSGEGMPPKYPAPQLVTVYTNRATITPGTDEVVLPLRALRLESARRVGLRWTRRKAADAFWEGKVAGEGMTLTFRGRWLLLAQLGTIAGWPEPS